MPETALAVDIGGTKVMTGLVDGRGAVLSRHREPTDGSSTEALYAQVLRLARTAMHDGERGSDTGPPTVCGVGCGGPSRRNYELISPLALPVWRDFPLRARLRADLGIEVHVDNDAKAIALGEGWCGAAVGEMDFLAMVVSTGIGAGIVSNGRLLQGAEGNAGHIGHVFVDPDGRADDLGAVGLLEGNASGRAIEAMTGRPAHEADEALRRRTGVLVGRAVAGVANLLDLRLALVGGSVALGFGEPFFESAQATLDDLCRIDHARGTRIAPVGLGADAPLVGAAAVGWVGAGREVLAPKATHP